jgi:prepilin-type N-terminal cleavage/methylation domain-containing protein
MRGFSVIEILCAMAIGVVIITAAIQSAFGDQSTLSSSAQAASVASVAGTLMDASVSSARQDFNLVYSTSSTGLFDVTETSVLGADLVSKLITTRVSLPGNSAMYTQYASLVSNLENADAPDTCDATVSGDLSAPIETDVSLRSLIGTTTGIYQIADVDALQHRLYIAVESTTYKTDPTLLIVDVSDPDHPTLLGMLDNASTTAGIAALRAASHAGTTYVYAANAGSFAKGQLQVIDATDPVLPGYPITYKIPTTYAPAAGNGSSIFYRAGFVHLGLTTAPGVTEYDIIDVHDPAHPAWRGGYSIGSTVERIQVKGDRAYLATDDTTRELMLVDAANPAAPYLIGSFNAPGSSGSGYGRSVFVRGTVAYFGRTWVLNAGTPELYALDVSFPGSISGASTRDIGTSAHPYGVYAVLARGERAFVLTRSGTGGQLQVLRVNGTDLANASTEGVIDLPGGTGGVALDCEEDTLYIASVDSSGQGTLSIVRGG